MPPSRDFACAFTRDRLSADLLACAFARVPSCSATQRLCCPPSQLPTKTLVPTKNHPSHHRKNEKTVAFALTMKNITLEQVKIAKKNKDNFKTVPIFETGPEGPKLED
jgi:hypothetical protein